MITEKELIERFQAEEPSLKAWGNYVAMKIREGLKKNRLMNDHDLNVFLKIPVVPRIKDLESFIGKALHRGKNYNDPYDEITDKVGIRFVVLLTREIEFIKEIVESAEEWDHSKDRDYEEERQQKPLEFNYQSIHYIVKPKKEIIFEGQSIFSGMPCEIQIRTLLQHAYAELTHDLTYKIKERARPDIIHTTAKSMALIETTDELFVQAKKLFESSSYEVVKWYDALKNIYKDNVKDLLNIDEKYNSYILDAISEDLRSINIDDIIKFVQENKGIWTCVSTKRKYSFIHRQPIILLLYYLACQKPYDLKRIWPLTESEIVPIFSDMGISM